MDRGKVVGHSSGGPATLRVYASFMAAADRRAAELLGGSLSRPRLEPRS